MWFNQLFRNKVNHIIISILVTFPCYYYRLVSLDSSIRTGKIANTWKIVKNPFLSDVKTLNHETSPGDSKFLNINSVSMERITYSLYSKIPNNSNVTSSYLLFYWTNENNGMCVSHFPIMEFCLISCNTSPLISSFQIVIS